MHLNSFDMSHAHTDVFIYHSHFTYTHTNWRAHMSYAHAYGQAPVFHAPQSTAHIARTYWRVHIPLSLDMSLAHVEFFRYHKHTLTREPTCCMHILTRRVSNENIDMFTKCTHTLSLEPTDFIIAHCRASPHISCTSLHFTFHTHTHTHTHWRASPAMQHAYQLTYRAQLLWCVYISIYEYK